MADRNAAGSNSTAPRPAEVRGAFAVRKRAKDDVMIVGAPRAAVEHGVRTVRNTSVSALCPSGDVAPEAPHPSP